MVFACASVCVLVCMYVYRCVVTCSPVCVHNVIVNIWGPQTMRAYVFLGFIFLEIRKKEKFWILSLEGITSTKNNHKPVKGNLSSSQLFVTSLHYCGWVYFFIFMTNGYSGMIKMQIVSTFFRDNENDCSTLTNFLFPSLKFHQW